LNKPLLALAGIALLGTAGIAGALVVAPLGGDEEGIAGEVENPAQARRPPSVTVTLQPTGDSGQSGIARITESQKGLEISLEVSGAAPGLIQAAEIRWGQPHDRQCDFPLEGAIIHKLTDVSDGRSTTTIDKTLYAFASNSPFVMVVKSEEQPVACGGLQRDDVIPADDRARQLVPPPTLTGPGPHSVRLDEVFYSGESGTAIITQVDGRVEVALQVSGQPADIGQPANIQVTEPYNWCSMPLSGALAYPLNDLSSGASVTRLDVDLSSLGSSGTLLILVYKSPAEPDVPVACGVIGNIGP
jgi:hypothetical protein